jgi:excisionase family DNA binding protein
MSSGALVLRCSDCPPVLMGDGRKGVRDLVAFIADIPHLTLMPNRQSVHKSRRGPSRPLAPVMTIDDREAATRLSALLRGQSTPAIRFIVATSTGESVELSPALLAALETAAGLVAQGAGVTLMARDEDLTTQQAADLLNVSRQYLVRLLDRGDIASHKTGAHRRVRAVDLAAYRESRDQARRTALAEMTAEAQQDGGYDSPAEFGPRRRA